MDPLAQHRHLATLQKHWQTDANKDMVYNQHRAQIERAKGNYVLAAGYAQEARWDRFWGNRRGGIVRSELKKS
jgi:hypothetical protein